MSYGQPGLRVRRKLFVWMSPSEVGRALCAGRPGRERAAARVESERDLSIGPLIEVLNTTGGTR